MLELSKVPVVDSNVTIHSFISMKKSRCIELREVFSCFVIYIPESKFNKCFKIFKNILENEEMYADNIAHVRGHKWFKPKDIDDLFSGSDYFMADRVPIYVEMFKHISRYNVCLERDSLMSQNIYVLRAVNKKIKRCKKINKIEGLPYLNL